MSDHSSHSSDKADSKTQAPVNAGGGAGGAGFADESILRRADVQASLSGNGDMPTDPKTVMRLQSTLGNRTTVQLLRKQNAQSKLQRKSVDKAYPFGGLRIVQRNEGGDNPVDEEEGFDLGEEEPNWVENPLYEGPEDDQDGYEADDESEEDLEQDIQEDNEVVDGLEQDGINPNDVVEAVDEEHGPEIDEEEQSDQDDVEDNPNQVVDDEEISDEDIDDSETDVDDTELDDAHNPLANMPQVDELQDTGTDTDSDTSSDTGGGEKKGKSIGSHIGSGLKNVGKGVLNATVGLGLFSAVDFWKGVLEVDEEKQETLYGDNWKAWTFLENTVNLTQAVADITTSIGFITAIAGAITTVLFPPAGPFLVTMSTIAGTFATIAHIITGVGRIILGAKLASRLSELEGDPKGQALVKGTMIRQFVGAVANTIGAVTGGIGGAFSPVSAANTTLAGLAGQSGAAAAAKAGGSAAITGLTNQAIGGSSGDAINAITGESTEHLVDRKMDTSLIQRSPTDDAIASVDAQIEKMQKLKTNLSGGLPDIESSEAKDEEKKALRQKQLEGVNESVPKLAELDETNQKAKEQAEQAEKASGDLESQITDREPPEEKKKSLWGKIKSAAKKAAKVFLQAFAALKRKVMGLIAKVKQKLTSFLMKLLGVEQPAKEIAGVMQDKQQELPEALKAQEENKQQSTAVKDEIKQGIGDLDKAEAKAQKYKQQLIEQKSQEQDE